MTMSQVQEPAAEYAPQQRQLEASSASIRIAVEKRRSWPMLTRPSTCADNPTLFYSHPHGQIWLGDAIVWLRSLPSASVDMAFFDPPYGIKKAGMGYV